MNNNITSKYLILISMLPLLLMSFYTKEFGGLFLFSVYGILLYNLALILKHYFYVVILPIFLLSIIETPYIFITRTTISKNVIASIFESDISESLEFFSSPFFNKFLIIVLVMLTILLLVIWVESNRQQSRNSSMLKHKSRVTQIGLLIFLLTSYQNSSRSQVAGSLQYASGIFSYFPLNSIIVLKQTLLETALVIRQFETVYIAKPIQRNKNNKLNIVLVIGESSRRDALGLYNPKVATTKSLLEYSKNNSSKVIVFSDALSVAPFTRVAVPSLLSVTIAKDYNLIGSNPNILQVINKNMSITTSYIAKGKSTQFHDQLINSFTKHNQIITYSNEEFDESLFSEAKSQLNKSTSNMFLTLQLSGSHFRYSERYPSNFNCFIPVSIEANYLNSIRYTDYLLGDFFTQMDSIQKPILTIYLSDHGEYVNDNGNGIYGHGYKNLSSNELEIPLIVTLNDFASKIPEYKVKFDNLYANKDQSVSLDNISHTIMGMLGLDTNRFYKDSYDITNPLFTKSERFIIDRAMDINSLNKLELDKKNTNKSHFDDFTLNNKCI